MGFAVIFESAFICVIPSKKHGISPLAIVRLARGKEPMGRVFGRLSLFWHRCSALQKATLSLSLLYVGLFIGMNPAKNMIEQLGAQRKPVIATLRRLVGQEEGLPNSRFMWTTRFSAKPCLRRSSGFGRATELSKAELSELVYGPAARS